MDQIARPSGGIIGRLGNLDKLKLLSERLLEKEVLDSQEVKKLLGMDGTVGDTKSDTNSPPDKPEKGV